MNTKESFGKRIRELRLKNNLTLEELGKLIGKPKQTINNWEMFVSTPPLETLWKLADYFDVSLDYLVGRNDNLC